MEEQIRTIFQAQGIAVPEEDIAILQGLWMWAAGLKEKTKEMEAGSFDIAITHVVKEGKK